MLNWQHLLDGMIPKHHRDLFATTAIPTHGLSAMLVLPGKSLCPHHKFACMLARCHCKQWVPSRLIGLRVRSFRLKILQQNPIFVLKNYGFLILKYLWFVNFKYICKTNNQIKKKTFLQLIYTFSCVNPPGRDMNKFITSISPWYTPIHGIISSITLRKRWQWNQ